MFELTGKLFSLAFNMDGKAVVSFTFDDRFDAIKMMDKFYSCDKLMVKVGKYKKKRSLDANAYFHVLVNKIASAMNLSDDETKQWLVKSYGTLARDEDGNLIGAMLPSGVNVERFYPHARDYKTEIRDGKEYTCYLFYERTRDLDTAQFSRLLEGTVQEAKNLGIETKSKEEIESILKQWEEKQ